MKTPDFAKLLGDNWALFVAPLIGSTIGHIFIHRPPDIKRVRHVLGRALNRFSDVPPERLNPALLAAARSLHRGWSSIVSILITAFWFFSGAFSSELYRAVFPELPRWHSMLVGAIVVTVLYRAILRIGRRTTLRRLEHLLNATGNA